jgi:CheY-like chemotaxis protein
MNSPRRVLVVEDEADLIDIYQRMLKILGVEVHVAGDGKRALALLNESAFDLILTDLNLPDKTELDLCSEIWERFPHQPILVVSGSAYDDDTRLTRATGVILKPFRMEVLLNAVRKILHDLEELGTARPQGFLNQPL